MPVADSHTQGPSTAGLSLGRWALGPDARALPVTADAYWAPQQPELERARAERAWEADPRYFVEVRVSALAAGKMLTHAGTGAPTAAAAAAGAGWREVMGLALGYFSGRTLVVTDSFAMPVAAGEVEAAMTERSQIYMADYLQYHRRLGRAELGCVGWYHSHPGYTCFLSGVDVATQRDGQRAQDPWVALVVDPVRSAATGRIDLKAFRTLPAAAAGQQPQPEASGAVPWAPGVPPERLREYGAYAHQYYELAVTLVRSTSDAAQLEGLQARLWASTLTGGGGGGHGGATTHTTAQLLRAAALVESAGGAVPGPRQRRAPPTTAATTTTRDATDDDGATADASGNGDEVSRGGGGGHTHTRGAAAATAAARAATAALRAEALLRVTRLSLQRDLFASPLLAQQPPAAPPTDDP